MASVRSPFRTTLAFALLPCALAVSACSGDDGDADGGAGSDAGFADSGVDAGTPDSGATLGSIVDVASDNGLDALVQAATSAGLATTLDEGGPFTVFAPTDDAFSALADAIPSDPGLLANVLLHHVVAGEQDSATVLGTPTFTTLAKTTLAVDADATPPTIGGAALSGTLDVAASNGVVHVLDAVMVPPTVAEAAAALDDLSSLDAAVGDAPAEIADVLGSEGPITVFAPVNSAFAGVDLSGLTAEALGNVLAYHVVADGQALAGDLIPDQELDMANGDVLTVRISGEDVTLEDGMGNTVSVIETDIRLLNGVVHLVDGVLMPPAPPPGTIVDVAETAGLTSLLSAATTAGLAPTLDTGGPFTVFAPTNAAFAALGGAAPTDPDLLANVLLHHVVPGRLDSAAVVGSPTLTTAANFDLTVDAAATPPTVGGAPLRLDDLDIPASNGTVHLVDQVIVPPTIGAAAGQLANLSTLATAVGSASQPVQDTLTGPDKITVFAPIDSAFSGQDVPALLADQARLDAVLGYHVTAGQALSSDLSNGQVLTMSTGETVTVGVSGPTITLTDSMGNVSTVVAPDVRLLNGTVHLIDGVLMPPVQLENIVDTAQSAGLTELLTAATTAGLADTLANAGPFTVFAPTNAAFTALGAAAPSDPGLLANVLLHHVVDGVRNSSTVLAATDFTTLAGTTITVDAAATPPTIGGARLSATLDVMATNGVVHVTDDVLVPPSVLEQAAATPALSTLTAAVNGASPSVAATLDGPGPITVFAPVDTAFAGLDVPALLADVTRLDDILTYHVATGQTLAGDLSNGQVITMANGADLTVSIDGSGNVTLTDGLGQTVSVIDTDLRLLNGTVHLIDGVLNPGNIVEQGIAAGLTSLVDAVNRVGLGPTLRAGGPFTVFAPTNAAVTALGVNLTVVQDPVLANVLVHHVVNGNQSSATVLGATSFTSLANTTLAVDATATPPTIGGAPLSSTLDVIASNGTVHVIDAVMVPPTTRQLIQTQANLSTAEMALSMASTSVQNAVDPQTLTGAAPITGFLPNNAAFTASGINLAITPQPLLDAVLTYHVVPGQSLSGDLTNGQVLTTANGATVTVNVTPNAVTLTDGSGGVATVVQPNVRTLSGVVHIIDRVLQPQ